MTKCHHLLCALALPIALSSLSCGPNGESGSLAPNPSPNPPTDPPPTCTESGITLNSGLFCMTLDNRSVMKELRYGPSSTSIPVRNLPTNEAGTSQVTNVTATDDAPSVKKLIYEYAAAGSTSTMKVTTYPRFLDFQLQETSGNLGELTMFGAAFPLNETPFNARLVANGGIVDFVELSDGFFAGLVKGNPQTQIWTGNSGSTMVNAVSPASLPATRNAYNRGQRFAMFVARAHDLPAVISDIEALYGIQVGIKMKQRAESNYDYLFLTDTSGASSKQIIDLVRSMGFRNVLLQLDLWCDWTNPTTPWLVRPSAIQLVTDLKAAGILVGAHSFVHHLAAGGYYANTYPSMVTAVATESGLIYRYDSPLVVTVARDYANAIKSLGANWVYFDGAEQLLDANGSVSTSFDWYLRPFITETMLKGLAAVGAEPIVFQQSSTYSDSYHFTTRLGQADYWDNASTTPTSIINSISSRAPTSVLSKAFLRPDLGWFPMCIHTNSGCRPPTQNEWMLVTQASVTNNVPLGIQTDYQSLAGSPIKATIIQLVRDAIQARGATPP